MGIDGDLGTEAWDTLRLAIEPLWTTSWFDRTFLQKYYWLPKPSHIHAHRSIRDCWVHAGLTPTVDSEPASGSIWFDDANARGTRIVEHRFAGRKRTMSVMKTPNLPLVTVSPSELPLPFETIVVLFHKRATCSLCGNWHALFLFRLVFVAFHGWNVRDETTTWWRCNGWRCNGEGAGEGAATVVAWGKGMGNMFMV